MPSMKPLEWGLLFLLSLFWGGSFFFIEVALRGFTPLTIVFFRLSGAAVILAAVLRLRGLALPAGLRQWWPFVIMGVFNNVVPMSCIVWGQTHIEAGTASIFNATTPIFTVILAHFLTRDEKLTPGKMIGVLVAFGGVFAMMRPELRDGITWRGLGQAAVLCASVSYSLAGIYGKRLSHNPPMVNAAAMLICSSTIMLCLILTVESPWSLRPGLDSVLAVAALATVSSAVAYLIYFRILASAGATNVLLVTFLIPVSALALGAGLLNEKVHPTELFGVACIFLGLAVIDGRPLARLKAVYDQRKYR